ncbi:hypothetical protein [Dactylosporangium sp. CA-233914]|uniref:hypothetical protein n=1 Tax=Dactylosporangium sp. CA-233914 TaxID=3239934 RepID=UPI003D8AA44F
MPVLVRNPLRVPVRVRVTDRARTGSLVHRAAPADTTTDGDKEREALFARVGPAMLMYNCISGQDAG